jgi:16S rRNA (cytosine967-C5)-methyltransferase
MTSTTPRDRGPRAKTRNVARRNVDPVRQLAFAALRTVAERDAYANLVLPAMLREARLEPRDAAFATELTYGSLRGRGTYDAVIAKIAARPLADIDDAVLDALRMGAHQILDMRVPAHAAVAATVDLVRVEIGSGAAGFANAVLRRMTGQDRDAWLAEVAPAADEDPDAHLAVATSHPVWIVRALRDALRGAGRDAAELPELLAADNTRPEVTAAALPGLVDRAELLAGGGVPGRLSPYAVRLTGAPDGVAAVREGRARIQDEGSQLVAATLAAAAVQGPDRGRWLDLCAGPGGKAALLAALLLGRRDAGELPPEAGLTAVEPAEHRVRLVRGAVAGVLRRAPGTVEVRTGDGREVGEREPDHYDRVLVDVPCTGLGALRRRPEARWRRMPSDLAMLAPLQRALLVSALAAVRPGGVVGYVTCSPHLAETRAVVDDVLRRRPDVHRLDARVPMAEVLADRSVDLGPGPDVQLWPHRHGTDAMYLALLCRSGSDQRQEEGS